MSSLTRHMYSINPVQPFSVSHLPSFIRLVDYLVVNTLYILVVNAVAKLLAVFQEQVRQTPSHAIIQSWNQHSEATTDPAEEEMDKKVGHCVSIIYSVTIVITISTKLSFQADTDQCSVLVLVGVCVFISLLSQNLPVSNLCSSLS